MPSSGEAVRGQSKIPPESVEAVKAAVRCQLGVAIISRLAVEQDIATGSLLAFTVSDLNLKRKFYLIKQQRKVLPPAAEALFDFILSQPREGKEIGNKTGLS